MITRFEGDEIAEPYAEVKEDFDQMPPLSELGETISVEYYDYFSYAFLIFTCDADTLICKYGEDEYEEEKAALDEKYVFQSETMGYLDRTCEPTVEIDGYLFRALSVEDYENGGIRINDLYYPKRLFFIATNDETREIVYMSFYDDDIDYIESLEEFILDSCGWEHIR